MNGGDRAMIYGIETEEESSEILFVFEDDDYFQSAAWKLLEQKKQEVDDRRSFINKNQPFDVEIVGGEEGLPSDKPVDLCVGTGPVLFFSERCLRALSSLICRSLDPI